ncbi:PilZ domain-containing protein [Novosphingopyxis sp.]|uniref:PilZ domain-containing protein n=1 Tax=Novosphingopyxis sp. TaxID=2709690 RepID=UPI003B5A8E55
MSSAALNNFDLRQAARHRADFKTIMERSRGEEHFAHICNVSANGFMIDDADQVQRGDRVSVRLPVIGRIEAHCVWTVDTRAGFQLERILRMPDFLAMLDELQTIG